MTELREVLLPAEAAEMIGYSRATLLRECRRGRLPFRRVNRRKVIFLRSELLRWIDRLPGRCLSEVTK